VAAWWSALTPLNQIFWGMAVLCTTLLAWQLVAALPGLGEAGRSDLGGPGRQFAGWGARGSAAQAGGRERVAPERPSAPRRFRLISTRTVFAFLGPFSWAAALYLGIGSPSGTALLRAALWGLVGMAALAVLWWATPRLAEQSAISLNETVGLPATVYVSIPRQGTGQVRILIGDRVSYVRARSASGLSIRAGRAVRVVAADGPLLEVEEPG